MNYSKEVVDKVSTVLQYLAIDTDNRIKLSTGHTIRMDEDANLMYVCWNESGEEIPDHQLCANELSYRRLWDEVDKIGIRDMHKYTEEVKLYNALRNAIITHKRGNK